MTERDYFAAPQDVTLEYRKRAKSLPAGLVAFALVWAVVALNTVVLGVLWQLFCAVVLCAVLFALVPKHLQARRKALDALRHGTVTRRLRMDGEALERLDEAGEQVVERVTVRLEGLVDVRVFRDCVTVTAADDEAPCFELRDEDFSGPEEKRAFTLELVRHVEQAGRLNENRPPYNPWIGRL
jgi:hypothetical protein